MEQIGSYRIVRKLGEGGMGVVYEGLNDQISRRVAIKVLHAEICRNTELLARFYNEARATNLASHVGIVDVYELGQLPDGRAYIVMQFLSGESLADRLHRLGGRIPCADALRLCRQVASAMEAAHSHGIVHRDLKPDNVMIVPDSEAAGGERAKLVDFGIAKMLNPDEHPGEKPKTRAGTVLGTPAYMAPEQCRGSDGLTDKVDVYALGVILYECLSGRTPFLATGTGEMLAKHLYEQPQPLWELDSSLPADVVSTVHEMLHKQPESRPSMATLVTRLGALSSQLESHPGAAHSASSTAHRRTEALTPASSPIPPTSATGHPSTVARNVFLGLLAIGIVGTALWLTRPIGQHSNLQSVQASGEPHTSEPAPRAVPGKLQSNIPPTAAIPKVRWSITTEPPGAEVVDALSRSVLGTTPWISERELGKGRTRLLLRLTGYKEHGLTFVEDANEIRRIPLVPVEPPDMAQPEDSGPKRKKSRRNTANKPAQDFTDAEVKVVQ